MTESLARPSSDRWFIEDTFRLHRVHLFAGPPGAGKTTLMVQMMAACIRGERWFGKQTYPRPFAYISCDRSHSEVTDTFERLGVPMADVPVVGSTDLPTYTLTMEVILSRARELVPNLEVLFIEGLMRLIPGGKINDPQVVSNFMVALQKICEKHRLTIIVVTWSPKAKEGDSYSDPRSRAMGSAAFAGCADTMILVEKYKDSKDIRQVCILSHNVPDRYLFASSREGDGYLIECDSPGVQTGALSDYILAFDEGFRFGMDDLTAAFPQLSRSSIKRGLSKLLAEHEIVRFAQGRYRRSRNKHARTPELPPGLSLDSLVPVADDN